MAARANMERWELRVWITPEVGYALTTTSTLSAKSGCEDKDMLGSDEDTRLRGLVLSGWERTRTWVCDGSRPTRSWVTSQAEVTRPEVHGLGLELWRTRCGELADKSISSERTLVCR